MRQRPNRGAANQRALILEQASRLVGQSGVIGVADRDQHVADKSITADALDWRFREQRPESRVIEPNQFSEIRRAQGVARGEFGFAAGLRELVPRAGGETIVAAIDAVADRLAEFVRYRSLALDREVGNAASRIELVGCGKRRGRTDIEAGLA